jgi:hypothetical protein
MFLAKFRVNMEMGITIDLYLLPSVSKGFYYPTWVCVSGSLDLIWAGLISPIRRFGIPNQAT